MRLEKKKKKNNVRFFCRVLRGNPGFKGQGGWQ